MSERKSEEESDSLCSGDVYWSEGIRVVIVREPAVAEPALKANGSLCAKDWPKASATRVSCRRPLFEVVSRQPSRGSLLEASPLEAASSRKPPRGSLVEAASSREPPRKSLLDKASKQPPRDSLLEGASLRQPPPGSLLEQASSLGTSSRQPPRGSLFGQPPRGSLLQAASTRQPPLRQPPSLSHAES
jgi:hypothetical protein